MSHSRLKTIAKVLLILLFLAPALGATLLSSQANAEAQQYDGLQLIMMGVYNIPFLIVSFIAFMAGRSFTGERGEKIASTSLVASIASSAGGCILMLAWGHF